MGRVDLPAPDREAAMSSTEPTATVDSSLRLGAGFRPGERDELVGRMGALDARLRSFRADQVDLQLSVKERDTPSQRVVLEAAIHRLPALVATSTLAELTAALDDVRDDIIRQITDTKERTEPQKGRPRPS